MKRMRFISVCSILLTITMFISFCKQPDSKTFFARGKSGNGASVGSDAEFAMAAQSGCPSGTPPAGGWPIVFSVNGNAYGPVQSDGLAAGLSAALVQRKVCSFPIAHPAIHSQTIFEESVIGEMAVKVKGLSQRGIVDKARVGIAGFSGGGGVATIVASRYSSTPDFTVRGAVSFYGPADLNAYFDFHSARAKGNFPTDPLFEGEKGPNDMCNTAHGTMKCSAFSASDIALVSNNLGGPAPGVVNFLSVRQATGVTTPIYACHGLRDDNVTAKINHRVITEVWTAAGVPFELKTYDGGHGVNWTVCPDSLQWLVTQLTQ